MKLGRPGETKNIPGLTIYSYTTPSDRDIGNPEIRTVRRENKEGPTLK